ncbi:MAG: DNA-protecting protein DprA [Lachnospiraceae bacterium]|nr:DNA-protecting protein DprA [Lachnospiraceae bacterium]
MDQKLCWFYLASVSELGRKDVERLLERFKTSEGIWNAAWEDIGLVLEQDEKKIEAMKRRKQEEKLVTEYKQMTGKGIFFVTKEEEAYPKSLRDIYEAPYYLFYKGELPDCTKPSIAVIGARNCSFYGNEMAKYFARELAAAGVQIISGLAYGIDGYAHEGALSAKKKTFGVLGCGVDVCYPKENLELFLKMEKQGGILSEYPPGSMPLAYHFPMRNRIISGLADGILVIEARNRSGTLITVDRGLEQGKDIYAIPGKITDVLSAGCNHLIQKGAKLVMSPDDILEELSYRFECIQTFYAEEDGQMSLVKGGEGRKKKRSREEVDSHIRRIVGLLAPEERSVYEVLGMQPKHLETILHETLMAPQKAIRILLSLELKGVVTQTSKNYFVINLLG